MHEPLGKYANSQRQKQTIYFTIIIHGRPGLCKHWTWGVSSRMTLFVLFFFFPSLFASIVCTCCRRKHFSWSTSFHCQNSNKSGRSITIPGEQGVHRCLTIIWHLRTYIQADAAIWDDVSDLNRPSAVDPSQTKIMRQKKWLICSMGIFSTEQKKVQKSKVVS